MTVEFAAAIAAGLLGALLGLGGGIIVVPVITLLLGVKIKYAIGASIVSVIATSSGAGATYVKEHISNIRVAMFLELATTIGAIAGAFLAGLIPQQGLYILFGMLMVVTAVMMLRQREGRKRELLTDPVADKLRLHGAFYDEARGETVAYQVCRSRIGFLVSGGAGIISGLLGVGGGIIKVPAMTLAMRIPMKAASATSNFMIGVTAAASAGVYFMRGDIDPMIAGPVAIGVLVGATAGTHLMKRMHSRWLRIAFTCILCIVAAEMLLKGFR